MIRGHRRGRLVVIGLAIALAGCGTTVDESAQISSGGEALGVGGPTAAPGGTTGGTGTTGSLPLGGTSTGSTGPEGPGGTTGTGTTGAAGTGTTGLVGSTTGGVPNLSGPGITDKEIFVGMVKAENTAAINAAAGAEQATLGDPNADAKAVIDYINKHGGVAGRRLHLVEAPFNSTSTDDVETQWSAVCSQFTQDKPRIFAALDAGTLNYRRCLHKAGVVQIDDDLPQANANEFQEFPGFVELGYPNLNRLAAEMVRSLVAQRYFTPWNTLTGRPAATGTAKVGILTYDDPAYRTAVNTFLLPGIRRLGLNVQVAWIGDVSKASDYGAQSAAVKSAQLRFAASGVDHVITFESNGGLSLFFMPNAESQRYFPRYGVNSSSPLQYLITGHEVQPNQVRGAMGFGWLPGYDLLDAMNPDNGPYSNAARRTCLAVFATHNITFDGANAEGVGLGLCSRLFLLRRVLDAVHGPINADSFVRSLDTVGSFQTGGTLGEFLGPGHHDGVSKIYYWQWFENCPVGNGGCMNYVGPRRTIP